MKRAIYRPGGIYELEYIRLNFPLISVPISNVLVDTDGEVIKEEKVQFIHLSFDAIGRSLRNEKRGIEPIPGFSSDPPQDYSAYCIPSDGHDMSTCDEFSDIHVAVGRGVEKYYKSD